MASRTPHAFSSVSVGLPSKVRGSEAEEEWQEVDWVTWSTGDVTVDADSFLLVFRPSGTGVKSKPLGNLVRASTVGGSDDTQRTLVVSTSDAVSGQYRFTFSSARDFSEFKKLADAVEAAHAAAVAKGAQASTRSSSGSVGAKQLATAIQDKYAGRWPLVFGPSDLYGPSPGGAAGSEVLLGRGAMVLLDPEEDSRTVGQYSLLFFGEDEGASHPVKSFPIGPGMTLRRREADPEDADEPAVMFELRTARDMPVYEASFDDVATAATFARDFRVRARLMDVSLKTAKGQRAVNEARGELKDLQRKSFGARLWRFACLLVILLLVAVIARAAMLFQEPGKGPEQIAEQLKKDSANAARVAYTAVSSAGQKACELVGGSVSTATLQKCLAVGGVSQVRECVEDLISYA
jgi:hypothetical protein